MSFEKAIKHLEKYLLEDRFIEFPISTATVKEAANVLGCSEGEIAKSLAFFVDDKPILIVTSGDQKIDNAKYKQEFSTKAKMIPFSEVNNYIGHQAGGVCPFGINDDVSVYLDESLKKHIIVYPACGSHNSVVKLSIEELEETSNYLKWVDVCKKNEVNI